MQSYTTSAIIGAIACSLIVALFQVLQIHVNDFFGILICLAFTVSGLVAVWHYVGEYDVTLTGREGVTLGALSGVFTSIVTTGLSFVLRVVNVVPTKEEAIAQTVAELEAAGANEAIEATVGTLEFMYGIGGVLVGLALAVVLGIVGGAIGRAIWKGEE